MLPSQRRKSLRSNSLVYRGVRAIDRRTAKLNFASFRREARIIVTTAEQSGVTGKALKDVIFPAFKRKAEVQ